MPDSMRNELGMPFGSLFKGEDVLAGLSGCDRVIAVGDVVSSTLINKGVIPHLTVYDRRNERRELEAGEHPADDLPLPETKVENPPGSITPGLVKAMKDGLERLKQQGVEPID